MKTLLIELLILSIFLFSSFRVVENKPLTREQYYSEITRHPEIIKEIFFYNQRYGYEPEILIALCYQESRFKQFAICHNKNGSIDCGLYSLNSYYFKIPNIFDIKVNISNGIFYFDYCFQKGGSIKSALMIYNCGKIDYNKSGKYVDDIISFANKLKIGYLNAGNMERY